ncbi:hypothetical protein F444_10805 [Phytophthora nicotianae P1976]|uniref:Uncharacterized protein n=1 Tax=Phytophthora nicotianae P1976 TaxID=1317066 RepID=A0A081A2Y1_PHYNI|nr:hypothetical protein F444_10805 [Phytophthora nicotianae P1976]
MAIVACGASKRKGITCVMPSFQHNCVRIAIAGHGEVLLAACNDCRSHRVEPINSDSERITSIWLAYQLLVSRQIVNWRSDWLSTSMLNVHGRAIWVGYLKRGGQCFYTVSSLNYYNSGII